MAKSGYLSETFDAAIGQGFQLVTPIKMANVIGVIANGGHRYRPYLVNKIVSPIGETIKSFEPEEVGSVKISERNLNITRDALHDFALPGGTAAYDFDGFPIQIVGKIGTAENPPGDDHGLFVAYVPFDNPTIVVAVVVEQGGFGSDSAAPIASKILEAAFNPPPSTDASNLAAEEDAEKETKKINRHISTLFFHHLCYDSIMEIPQGFGDKIAT